MTHQPHCPVPRAARNGEGAVCLCGPTRLTSYDRDMIGACCDDIRIATFERLDGDCDIHGDLAGKCAAAAEAAVRAILEAELAVSL